MPHAARRLHSAAALACLLASAALAAPIGSGFTVPITYYKLANGLKVSLSRDTTAPIVVVAVYYNIGFRIEPKDRTGFAHLFEHLMFQGSKNLDKLRVRASIDRRERRRLNGSTRFDLTNYFEVVPSQCARNRVVGRSRPHAAPGDHRGNLKNQQGVVATK